MDTLILLLAGCVVAAVIVRARRSSGRDGRTSLFHRREPGPGMVPLVLDLPDLEAHVALDALRSKGIIAQLAVSRSGPSLVSTIEKPTEYDIYVLRDDIFRARALLGRDG